MTASADPGGELVARRLDVLTTKLAPPPRRPGIIDRPRLTARLAASATPVVALVAPAGYGKSLAAAELARTWAAPIAWLSVDARDGDPATLLRGLTAAIAQVTPIADDVVEAVADPGDSPWSVAVPSLAAALASGPAITLVIDDVDRLPQDDAVDVILALVRALASGRVIVTGRSLGRLPGPRLQAAGLLRVFGRDDLALDADDVGHLLAALGIASEDLDAGAVAARTEGWAAGVYLTALAAMDAGARRSTPATQPSPTAPERLIEEYLRSEVLATLGPDDADLLTRSAVLDRLSGDLCDAVLERTGSGADLDRLERTNLFLIPLDAERRWYRPHHLVTEVLRADLERRAPDQARTLHRRASGWLAEHALPEEALRHAMRAGDDEGAALLATRLGQSALNAGRLETVRSWFAWFDDREVARRVPRFASLAALLFSVVGDADRAERWADIDDRTTPADDRAAGARAVSRVCVWRSDVTDILAGTTMAVRVLPPDDPLHTAAFAAHGLSLSAAGDDDAALDAFAAAVSSWERRPMANNALVFALAGRAAIGLARDDRRSAEDDVRRARSILVSNGMVEQPVSATVDALAARVAMAHGAPDQARRLVAHAQRLRPRTGVAAPWIGLRARTDLVRVLLALDDLGGARTLMSEIDELLARRPGLGTLAQEARDLGHTLSGLRGGRAGSTTLTTAELRLLPLLTTHLSFREIGDRLFISQNTVKTQAISIYRKLDATSRSEAVGRATQLGLLGAAPSDRFIHDG